MIHQHLRYLLIFITGSLVWTQIPDPSLQHGVSPSRHYCDFLQMSECMIDPFCIWDDELGECDFYVGEQNLCADLSPNDCESVFFCEWDEISGECFEFYSPGMGWGGFNWGYCMNLNPQECTMEPSCVWSDEMMECLPVVSFEDPCSELTPEGCNDVFFCHWNQLTDECEDGFGGYNPCFDLEVSECSDNMFCWWDPMFEICTNMFGGFPAQHFQDILNGHLADYIHFVDTTGYGVFQTITIESIEEGDLGDEIGFLDYDGIIGFGDCSDETGEILVGAGIWSGEPLTITTFGAMDFCNDDTEYELQVPGWVSGNPIGMVLWKAEENQEYLAYYDSETQTLTWSPEDQYLPLSVQPLLDLNSDGGVDILDIIIGIDTILGNTLLEPSGMSALDINDDSVLNILDIVIFVQLVLEL